MPRKRANPASTVGFARGLHAGIAEDGFLGLQERRKSVSVASNRGALGECRLSYQPVCSTDVVLKQLMHLKRLIRQQLLRVFNALPFALRYELFWQSARSLGVESYVVSGKAGPFTGAIWDQTIIKTYLRGTVWPHKEVATLLKFFNGRKGTLYDIGANIGMVTIPIAKTDVSVVAFEPDELNCSLLRANIARQLKVHDIRIIQAAVYCRSATLRFTRSPYNSGDHHLDPSGEFEVSAVALDDLPTPGPPFAVKIDTQGAEPWVFEGGYRTLKSADLIITEFCPSCMERLGTAPDAVFDVVRRFRYGRLISGKYTSWMTGDDLVKHLSLIGKDRNTVEFTNGIDFVAAREPF